MPLLKMFSRKWLFTTILVILGATICVRLGIWQLDRLAQRRVFNAQVVSMREASPLDLNSTATDSPDKLEWRAVKVTGEYDFANQVALRNQYKGDQVGFHLLTPLLFGGKAVLVDRGWIPADGNSAPSDWRKYDEPGTVTVKGQIRLGSGKPAFGGVADALPADGSPLWVWNNVDVEKIAHQLPYPLSAIYIQPNVDPLDVEPPIPYQPEVDLTEGPHFGYALQWFSFATILLVGYPFYLRKQDS